MKEREAEDINRRRWRRRGERMMEDLNGKTAGTCVVPGMITRRYYSLVVVRWMDGRAGRGGVSQAREG